MKGRINMKFKRFCIALMAALTVATSFASANAATTKYKVGDVNKSGTVNINDVTLIQIYLSGKRKNIDISLADFDGSEIVNIFDCTTMQLFFNQEIRQYGDYLYHKDTEKTATIYAYQGSASEITLPSYAYGWNITFVSVRDSAFNGNKKLKKLIIPASYTNLGYYSFADCKNLQYVRIMNSHCHIDSSTFDGCDNLTDWIMG